MAIFKKWSSFFNRANASDNDNAQVMLLDTTVSPTSNQNQRTSITQFLRSGKNLSDLSSFSNARTNLGLGSSAVLDANISSAPNTVVERDFGGQIEVNSIVVSNLTGGKALVSGGFGPQVIESATTSTELSYVSGVTSAIQSQLNSKQSTLTIGNITDAGTDGIVITGGTGAIIGSGVSIAQQAATASQNGYLKSLDWTTFNSKQSALTIGNFTDSSSGSDGITVSGGTGSVIGSGTSIAQQKSDSTHNGYLSSGDWTTFNNKQTAGNYITALTGDGTATGPGSVALTLATVNSNIGSFGSVSAVGIFTVNAKGLITAASSSSIQIAESQVTNLVSDLAGKQPTGNYITALTGDVTATGPGSVSATISAGAVTNSKMANMAATTLKGNSIGVSASPTDLSITSILSMLSLNQTANQVVFGNGASGITSNSNFTYNSNNQLILLRTSISGGVPLILNDSVFNSARNEIQFQNNGTLTFSVGHNNFSNISYVTSAAPTLQLGTNSSVVASFNTSGNLRLLSYGTGILHSDSSGNLTSSIVVNSDLAQMTANTIKGNNTGSSASPTDIGVTSLLSMLSLNQTANQVVFGNGASGITSNSNFTYSSNVLTLQGTMCAFQASDNTGFHGVGPFTGGAGPIFAYAGSNANYFTNATAGDGILRISDSTKTWRIGVGSSAAQFGMTSAAVFVSSGVSFGVGVVPSNAAVAFQIDSTTQVFLIQRMTTTQKNAISSPPEGSMVYDTTLHKLSLRTASTWETVTSI